MPMPTFTREEEYLVAAIRSESKGMQAFMWSYVLSGLALAGFAAFYGNVWMMFSAFVVVCGFRVYEEWWQEKWKPIFRSIILKYDEAVRLLDSD